MSYRRIHLAPTYPFIRLVLAAAIGLVGCSDDGARPSPGVVDSVPRFTYDVVNAYPHDPDAFTQGLVYLDGVLYEGTGFYYGESTLREVRLETGEVLRSRTIGSYFGEGITIVGDRIVQLTWTSNVGFVWALDDFSLLDDFSYPTEGWGLTHDGSRLIMSDGSARLNFLHPETFANIGGVDVTDGQGRAVEKLNELEFIDGEVWANVYLTDLIARIDPDTGKVTAWVDLTDLLPPPDRAGANVLNGIAYDAAGDRLFVTGKLWPKLFEIDLVPIE